MIGAARDPWAAIGAVVPLWALGFAIACGHGRATVPIGAAAEGISIAIYDRSDADPDADDSRRHDRAHGDDHGGYGVVDDRRWIDVASDAVVLDHVDPRAELPSLLIEPLAGAALRIGGCARDRIPASPAASTGAAAMAAPGAPASPVVSAAPPELVAAAPTVFTPVVRCAVRAAPGRYLVRLLYVVPALGYRARHDIAMTAASRATVTSRFAIATPAWHARAEVTLFDGMPGTQQPPRELAHGMVVLDGGTAVIAMPPRVVAGQLRRIYDGATQNDGDVSPRDMRWRRDSHPAVWVWLELDDAALARGPIAVHLELAGEPARDIEVPARARRRAGPALHLPLWIDDQLRGRRDRWTRPIDDGRLLERFAMSITNLGDTVRDVWVEEQLRPARRRAIGRTWPAEPTVLKTQLRMKLTVPPGKIERGGFEVEYDR